MANYYNKNLYSILNVGYDASIEEIKLAYRKLVRIYHPDVAGEFADGLKFKEIQEAYEVLSDETSRKKYDLLYGFYTDKIKKEREEQKQKDKAVYDECIKKAKQKTENTSSFSRSINDALDGLFNAAKAGKQKKEKKPAINGEDIKMDVYISCFEALKGTNRKINILHSVPCSHCEGRTFINGSECPVCKGRGQTLIQKKINVKIPKGVSQGSKVRIKKEGNNGQNGGKDGDLYLIINIEKNPYFDIDGMNILCNLPITPFEAVLGTEVKICVLDETINVKIPPMTSSGQKLRLPGLGLENRAKTKKGDIIITVLIKLPENLSSEEKEYYKKLKEISKDDIRKDLKDAK